MNPPQKWFYQFGPFFLDPHARTIKRENTLLSIGPSAFNLLLYLVQNSNMLLTRDQLVNAGWPGRTVATENLTRAIHSLRLILGPDVPIKTIKGLGYRFVVEVKVTSSPNSQEELSLLGLSRTQPDWSPGQTSRLLHVFLCHSSNDKSAIRELCRRLRGSGTEPWLDEEQLLPGQEWQYEIPRAVRNSDVVIVCLSNTAVTKSGYIQKEIRYALDVADEQPEGTIFLIPLRLDQCQMPERLSRWQWVNLFEETGYDKLLRALQRRAIELGLCVEVKS